MNKIKRSGGKTVSKIRVVEQRAKEQRQGQGRQRTRGSGGQKAGQHGCRYELWVSVLIGELKTKNYQVEDK
jgi:hypothetical protein